MDTPIRRLLRSFLVVGSLFSVASCAREQPRAAYPQPTYAPAGQGAYGPYTYNPNGYGQGTAGAPTAPLPATAPPTLGTALEALGALVRTIPGVLVVPPGQSAPPSPAPPVATAVPPVATQPPAAADPATAFENEVFRLTNEQRARGAVCGGQAMPAVPPVAFHPALQVASRGHSQDMASRGYFDHDTPEGKQPYQRAQAAGYPTPYVGENIGSGYQDAASAMAGWMASTGHCRNIMKGDYAFLGVGYAYTSSGAYHHYWTQNFGGK